MDDRPVVRQNSPLRCGSNVTKHMLEACGITVLDDGKHGPPDPTWDGFYVVNYKHPVSYILSLRRFFGGLPSTRVERWLEARRYPRRGVAKWHGRDLNDLAHHIVNALYHLRAYPVPYEELVADPARALGEIVRLGGGDPQGIELPQDQVYPVDGPVDHSHDPPFDASYYTEERWRDDADPALVEGIWSYIEKNGLMPIFESAGYAP